MSQETPEATRLRLRGVLARAQLERLDGEWCFEEHHDGGDVVLDPRALAMVRDAASVSQLVPAGVDAGERFALFGFHFPAGLDNSGFVGWLASELKAVLGTGVFVVCGSNSRRGGIYDYWGVPAAMGDRAAEVLRALAAGERGERGGR